MVRKKNFFYSAFNLRALFNCALLGAHIDHDLWEMHKGERGTLPKALDFLISYLEREKEWKSGQIELADFTEVASLLLIASTTYKDPKYLKLYEKVECLTRELSDANSQIPHNLFRLLYPGSFFLHEKR